MKTRKQVGLVILLTALGFTTASSAYIYRKATATEVHVLQFPLLLAGPAGDGPLHTLPKGTTMYYDKSYPEGFTRFKVYVNVDRFPLPLTELADGTEINPITAFKKDEGDLKRPSARNPITKEWLASILKSGQLSRDDIREILADYASGCAMAPEEEPDVSYAQAPTTNTIHAQLAFNIER